MLSAIKGFDRAILRPTNAAKNTRVEAPTSPKASKMHGSQDAEQRKLQLEAEQRKRQLEAEQRKSKLDRASSAVSTALDSSDTLLPCSHVRLPRACSRGRQATPVAFTIENFLSADECRKLIDISEACSYEAALVNVGMGRQIMMDDVRKSGRCIIDSVEAAQLLWRRLQHLVPHNAEAKWHPVGLNERLRFLKYTPGDYFAPHSDGRYSRESGPDKGDTSFYTLMIYLNEPAAGGETNFLSYSHDEETPVRPRTGLALLFDHELHHEGALLKSGVKYAIRTDVMFKRGPAGAAGAGAGNHDADLR